MSDKHYYFSLQYSAIQKTVLRHDRLWSMAGISQMLSRLNEIIMPEAVGANGTVIVAGGGKFTARFPTEDLAKTCRARIMKVLATSFPMLEYQASRVVPAGSLKEAKEKAVVDGREVPGLFAELKERKKRFRGYGVTFNPHFRLCEECGEYPAILGKTIAPEAEESPTEVCSVCFEAREASHIRLADIRNAEDERGLTTAQRIYRGYLTRFQDAEIREIQVPNNFENLFPEKAQPEDRGPIRRRMAVWMSDTNNMEDKVTIWLNQKEDEIRRTFNYVKDLNIAITVEALKETFSRLHGSYLPFRIVVAGGDDLCLVMDERYVPDFALHLSQSLHRQLDALETTHPMHPEWLRQKNEDLKLDREILPYCFGGSFLVTSVHTPFRKIHAVGEELMSSAKKETKRLGNSVNWCIMAEEGSPTQSLIPFEKPLYIEPANGRRKDPEGWAKNTFQTYLDLCRDYASISSSHKHQLIHWIMECKGNGRRLERYMIPYAASERETPFNRLLLDPAFRRGGNGDGDLIPARLATLMELLSIERNTAS